MAKQSKGQKRTVGRVMHEFKHGELKRGRGGKVKSRRQAIAIALHEAGASKNERPSKNRANYRKTKAKERRGRTADRRTSRSAAARRSSRAGSAASRRARSTSRSTATRAELMRQAQRRNVPGRSRMSKAELQRALKR